jgi:DNA-binding NarL/FixJ family response regulator
VRVVLAEDLTLLRDGLIRLLTAYDMEVVAAVDSGPELLRALITHRPDVAVVDVRLPPTFTDEGLRAAVAARAQLPGLPVLVLSQHVEQLYAKELLSTGTGGTAMDPEVVSQLLARHGRDEQLARLTAREREVLALMAEGHSNAGIAARLVVTEKAVDKHIGNIFPKLDLYPAEDANRRVLAVLTYLNALRIRGEPGCSSPVRHSVKITARSVRASAPRSRPRPAHARGQRADAHARGRPRLPWPARRSPRPGHGAWRC